MFRFIPYLLHQNFYLRLKKTLPYLLFFFLGCLFIPIPLLGDFHFESALVAGVVGCFWGGIVSSKLILKKESAVFWSIISKVYVFGSPLLLFSFFTDCLTLDGIGFWALTPIPSILFGISVGRFFRKIIIPFPVFFTVLSLIMVSIGILFIEFLTLPQVYFFNHVWGAWPGPIYDETVRVTKGFFFFRVFTIGWIIFLWILPNWKASTSNKIIATSMLLGMIIGYQYLPELGVSSPRDFLQEELPVAKNTDHFDLYFDKDYYTEDEMEYWALKHEFHFQQIITLLEIDWPEGRKIESYLYANAWQKKELVGAKFTSYVPIWLEQDQLHIAKQHLDGVLKHELVHVISKQFGNNLFNGSWSIGLVEGLAEGIAKDASSQSTLNQILAADPPYPSAKQMKSALSPTGFYSSAASISYTTAGSFVSYLLEQYPVSKFKQAYPSSDFEAVYQQPFDSLIAGWHRSLPEVEIDSVDQQVSDFIFSQRSIFQKNCPHMVSPVMKLWDSIQFHEANKNNETALPIVEALYRLNPENLTIKRKWLQYQLEFGNYSAVTSVISEKDSIPAFGILRADAFALSGEWEKAYNQLEHAWALLPDHLPSNYTYSLEVRSDTLNWKMFVGARYNELIPPPGIYDLNISTETLILNEALNESFSESLNSFSSVLLGLEKNSAWFNIYESLIDRLIFLKEFDQAQKWIDTISVLELRPRYIERLAEQQEWLTFMENE